MEEIPKIIHFVFLNKDEPLPGPFKKCLERTKSLHPGWTIYVHNEDDANKIISHYFPELLPIFKGYGHYIQKADIIRAILIYVFGGFYMDLDMYCLKPIDDALLKNQLIIPEERSVQQSRKKLLEYLDNIYIKHLFRLGNYMFGGIPQHTFWLFFLKEVLKRSLLQVTKEGDILEITGPSILTNVYHEYKKNFPEITIMRNIDRKCLMPFHKEISCHFGNYAAHLHQGTWRWQHLSGGMVFHNNIPIDAIENGMTQLEERIKVSTFFNVAIVKPRKEKSNIITTSLTKQLSFSIKKKHKATQNIIVINLSGLKDLKHQKDPLNVSLIITESVSNISIEHANTINIFVSVCFVFCQSCKAQLRTFGIKIQIFVLPIFYLPVVRDFSITGLEYVNKFTIGLLMEKFNKKHIKAISDLITSLKAIDNNIDLLVFHTKENKNYISHQNKRFKIYNIREKTLSKALNSLSCFISLSHSIEDLVIVNTCLYMGIPVALKKCNDINKYILRFCKQIKTNDMVGDILDLKNNYRRYNIKSINAAKYLEDRFSLETISSKVILKTINP